MIDPLTVVSFLIVSVLLTIAPGPDILFVIAQSMSQGKFAGIATALGLCTGLIAHTLGAALGISLIIYHSALGFTILKFAGAAYLLYLAIQAIIRKETVDMHTVARKTYGQLYRQGVLMNLLNPKVALFFLAFLPQFVTRDGNIQMQMLFLGTLFLLQALVVFTVVSYLAGIVAKRLKTNKHVYRWIDWMKAGIFTFIALKLATAER